MNKQKGISTTLSILLVILLVIVGGAVAYKYYLAPGEKPSAGEVPGEAQDETADWKTYRNENGGYEIKYPADLLIKHTVAEEGKAYRGPDFVDSLEINSQDSSTTSAKWTIDVFKNTEGLNAQQQADKIGTVTPTRNKVITKINISGIEGRKVVIDYLPSDVDPENPISTTGISIVIIKSANIYEFFCLDKVIKKSGTKDYDCLRFNQMLSTFRFLE